MLTIVPATSADTETVIAILTDAVHWLQSRELPTWNLDTLPVVMNSALSRGEVYLARLNDVPVGTVSIQWSDPPFWGERPDDAGYIHKLAITRAAAGQRIGAQVVTWAEGLIIKHGRRYARLDCHAENPGINRLYQAAGYQLRGTITLRNTPFNLYEKTLNHVG